MNDLERRRAEQALRELAESYGRPSHIRAQFQRDGVHPELWDKLDKIDRRKRALGLAAREIARRGPTQRAVSAIMEAAKRCDGEETQLFSSAIWDDLGEKD